MVTRFRSVNGFIQGIDFPTCRRNSARFNKFSETRVDGDRLARRTGEEERDEKNVFSSLPTRVSSRVTRVPHVLYRCCASFSATGRSSTTRAVIIKKSGEWEAGDKEKIRFY